RPARRDRLPGLVVHRHRDQPPLAPAQEEAVAALENAPHLEPQVTRHQTFQLVRLEVLAARAPAGDAGQTAVRQVIRNPPKGPVAAGLVEVVDDVAEDDEIVAIGEIVESIETARGALPEVDEREPPP